MLIYLVFSGFVVKMELDVGVSKTDITVTMAPKKVYAVYCGKSCGTETEENEHKSKFYISVSEWKLL